METQQEPLSGHLHPGDNGEASQRVPTAHEPLLRVDDVPDNRRPERRMRVGTRTTARDWQWVNQAIEEDGEVDVAPQRVHRLPEAAIGRRRRGGRGGQGRGGGEMRQPEDRMCHTPPGLAHRVMWMRRSSSSDPRGGPSLTESPQGALGGSSSQAQIRTHVDLNQPATDPFVDFSFALGGTPPSAFVDGPTHMNADDQAPPAAEDPEPRRGRRAVRRRGCGTGGHM
ncbi:hypothetical protein PIB30_083755 [Stylosanthes scabra]|uniref:Uncharacterized protein n=1 Tax=Stylosanthes scabra TaxID=79078 RepID=A0ABU6XQS4_9FABA|nr:hypothetical protein [Stylosanthes scabra]